VIAHFSSGDGSRAAAFPSLTEREREALDLIASGKGNAAIAHELVISLKTRAQPRLQHLQQAAGTAPIGRDRKGTPGRGGE